MTPVITPKSDQINAEDFLAGPKSYTIAEVEIRPGAEQPVSIRLVGEDRVWRPCKSMSRCLVAAWGPDASVYAGHGLTLYRDPKVKWGGLEVGGIRISHLSHIERDMLLQLTATKGKRSPHVIKPLQAPQAAPTADDPAQKWASAYVTKLASFDTLDRLNEFANEKAARLADLESKRPELHSTCIHALDARRIALSAGDAGGWEDDGFGDE
jgi:hypothetical protein